ncbi:amidohydrolase family protein [Mesoflavibacter zeaxanthinifaciens]|uniref:amidohydrolase family protein n=1 Tax=Mesoflavibacter zeaxanthinifaciens TaxID=393060 RepID=UPI003A8E8E9B
MENDQKIIDIHIHIFNLNYLPIRGILQAHKIPRKIARLLEIALLHFTESSNFDKSLKQTFILDDTSILFPYDLIRASDEEVIEDIMMRIEHSDELNNNPEIIDGLSELNTMVYSEKRELEYQYFFQEMDTLKDSSLQDKSIKKVRLSKLIDIFLKGFSYLKWFRFMMRSEVFILNDLLNNYQDVNQFVFHMMDAELFFHGKYNYSSRAKLSIDKKIQNMSTTILQSNNRLIGFVPFNPKRENGLQIVTDAIENKGFKGAKFYPPLGYRASINCNPEINKRIGSFFKYCESKKIPVFTHCTPTGFESIPGKSGLNSDPIYWEKLLIEHPDLILCLGHAGGVEGWFATFDETKPFPRIVQNNLEIISYAEKVHSLCVSYKNVYCGVGFLDDVKDQKLRKNFIKRLNFLFEQKTGKYLFKDKIMYGSDWHMLFNEGLQFNYHEEYLKMFKNEGLKLTVKDQFFYLNASKYLKLNEDER